jgi:hypothetical protein
LASPTWAARVDVQAFVLLEGLLHDGVVLGHLGLLVRAAGVVGLVGMGELIGAVGDHGELDRAEGLDGRHVLVAEPLGRAVLAAERAHADDGEDQQADRDGAEDGAQAHGEPEVSEEGQDDVQVGEEPLVRVHSYV